MKKILCFIVILTLALSFNAFASDFECVDSNIPNNSSAAWIGDNLVSLTFSEEVQFTSILSTSVTKNGVALEITEFSVMLNDIDSKIVEVTINALEYGATYVIDYSDYSNGSTLVVNNPATLTFTVEEEPEVLISNPTIIAGIETGTITYPVNVTADALQGFIVDVDNGALSDKDITLVCALYDDNGLLKKVVTSSKTVLAGATDSIVVGTFIPAATDVGVNYDKVKIFVWDTMENKSPYIAEFTYTIQ